MVLREPWDYRQGMMWFLIQKNQAQEQEPKQSKARQAAPQQRPPEESTTGPEEVRGLRWLP